MAYPIYSNQTPEEIDITRKRKMAEILRQQSMQNDMQGQMISGHYVGPSWTQGIAKLLQAKNASDWEKQADTEEKAYSKKRADAIASILKAGTVETPTQEMVSKPGYEYGGSIYDSQDEALKAAGIDPTRAVTQGIGSPVGVDVRELNIDGTRNAAPIDWFAANQAQPQGMQQDGVPMPNIREVMRDFTVPGQPVTSYDPQKMMEAAMASGDLELASNIMPVAANMASLMKAQRGGEIIGKIGPDNYTPESLAKFAKTRDYADLVHKQNSVFGNVNPGQFTPESLAAYQRSGNYADLVPRFAPQKLDTGDTTGLYDPVTARPIGTPLQKRLPPQELPSVKEAQSRATAQGSAIGKAVADNAISLPQAEAEAQRAVRLIDEMVGSADGKTKPHPGFRKYVGTFTGGMQADYLPGSDAADFKARFDEIGGGAFLQAFETLKGSGQITEMEGAKATAAITRMQRRQSQPEFTEAAREFQNVIKGALARKRSGLSPSEPTGSATPKGMQPYKDADKERRYQEWLKQQGGR